MAANGENHQPSNEAQQDSLNEIPRDLASETRQTRINSARSPTSKASQPADAPPTRQADDGLPQRISTPSSQNPSQPRRPLQRPHFSLAGSMTAQAHAPSYVDPEYNELNPRYQRPENAPVWGLAKPLPRVVRPGMRRGQRASSKGQGEQGVVEDTEVEVQEPGTAEAIPQLGLIDVQRQQAGKERTGRERRNSDERGYAHQQIGKKLNETVSRLGSGTDADHYVTPMEEKGNPVDEWFAKQPSTKLEPFETQNEDLGNRRTSRLSSLQEVPSHAISTASTISKDSADGADPNKIDLEAGENHEDEWSLEKDEADRYAQEEWETHNGWASFRARFREPLAECLATMIAVLIGLCTNLAVQTSNNTSGYYQSQNWAWGLGVTIAIYVAGGISGGHLNPVISLTLCLYRGFPFRKALVYIAAQLLGAFFAGLIAYGIYRDAIASYNSVGGDIAAKGGSSAAVELFEGGTGKALFTQPAQFAGVGASFANEFVATAILACAVLALGDDSNAPPGAGMHAFIVGLVVFVLTMAFGYTTGACLNPARDFGPRLAAAIVGYGGRVFTDSNVWWIYGAWGATISGGLVGGFVYDAAIFVGGESPINYPRGKRRRMGENAKKRWWHLKSDVKGQARKDGPRKEG
ncbi:putative membrane protein [Lachnellula suecica]|uniref:Putative membrane protein n=1 Tax=Lachnellula suecica TaxID=602035 RepID=A0A8T9CLI3_9HELO|nr:putative membrane protein [Lachnellula suecica]